MAGPKTRRGSTVKGNKSGEVASARVVPGTSSEDAGGNEPMASGANSVESKRLLRSDTRINAEKTEEGESGEASVKPPPVPFVTRPKMLSHMGRAKKMTGASFNNTTTFHLFGKLPPELRTKIWKHAIPGPRVIQVKVKHVPSQYSSHLIGTAFNSSTPVPAMLHTCHESRVVAVLQYELGMRSHVQDPRIYVDFKRDIIYFGQINFDKGFTLSGLIRDVPMSELSKICFLGMSQDVWNFKPFCNGHVLMDFHSLERLTLAMERADVTKHKNVMFVKPKEADFTVSAFYDPDMDDSDTGIFWPDEMEDIILENLISAYDEHDREVPEVKYKVLAGADTKSTSKGKGKGKAVRK